jgi:hypothetical protein
MKKEDFISKFAKELKKQTGLEAENVHAEDIVPTTFRMIVEVNDSILTFEAPLQGLTKKLMQIQAQKIGQIMSINKK